MLKKIIFVSLVFMFVFASIFFVFNFSLAQFGLENFGSGSSNAFFSANQSVPATVARIISWVIGIIGVLLLGLLIYGGILYATSAGGEQIETAKKVLTYAIIGIVIVAISFAITNYVVVGLFSDDLGGPSPNSQPDTNGDPTSPNGNGGGGNSQVLTEELLREGEVLIQEGEEMVRRGEELGRRGQAMLDDDDEDNDEAGRLLIDDGTELINGGEARVEGGNRLLDEGRSDRGEDGNRRNTETVDINESCKKVGDTCGVLRDFCCVNLECDEGIADSGWPRAFGKCAYGNPECKEEGERCLSFGQECCGELSCLEGYCTN